MKRKRSAFALTTLTTFLISSRAINSSLALQPFLPLALSGDSKLQSDKSPRGRGGRVQVLSTKPRFHCLLTTSKCIVSTSTDSRARLGIELRRTCKGMKSKAGVHGPVFNCFIVLQEKRENDRKKRKSADF